MLINRLRPMLLIAIVLGSFSTLILAQEAQQFSAEQKREFLLKAEVVRSRQTSKGITIPYRLTLSDGQITHDALFQSVDERRNYKQFSTGASEINYVDSYLYNIAAYELAKLLGLDHMLPVTVLRRWNGKMGSLAWWLDVQMDEADRLQKKIPAPDPASWNRSIYEIRVFSELIYDTDRNATNVLVGKNWEVYMIDFTRAFRLSHDLKSPKNLVQCSRSLLERLRALDGQKFADMTRNILTRSEVQAVMKRRDKIIAYFEKLIAEKGEDAVLF